MRLGLGLIIIEVEIACANEIKTLFTFYALCPTGGRTVLIL